MVRQDGLLLLININIGQTTITTDNNKEVVFNIQERMFQKMFVQLLDYIFLIYYLFCLVNIR